MVLALAAGCGGAAGAPPPQYGYGDMFQGQDEDARYGSSGGETYANKWGLFRWTDDGNFATRAPYYAYGLLSKFFRGPAAVCEVRSADPLLRVEPRRGDGDPLRSARGRPAARHERVEQRLRLGERHAASRRTGAASSASIARARSDSRTTRSSGGTWSSHSTSV